MVDGPTSLKCSYALSAPAKDEDKPHDHNYQYYHRTCGSGEYYYVPQPVRLCKTVRNIPYH